MSSLTAAGILKIAERSDEQVEGLHYIFAMRRNIARAAIASLNTTVSDESFAETQELMAELLENEVSADFVFHILALYPYARISLIEGGMDTQARESLASALSHFLLGCEWPTYGDNVNIEAFTLLLQKQYQLYLNQL